MQRQVGRIGSRPNSRWCLRRSRVHTADTFIFERRAREHGRARRNPSTGFPSLTMKDYKNWREIDGDCEDEIIIPS